VIFSEPARRRPRRAQIRRRRAAGLLVVVAAIVAARGCQSPASSPLSDFVPVTKTPSATAAPDRGQHRRALGVADGAVPDGTTVFDDTIEGVAKLDPALLGALRQAAPAAGEVGVEFVVDSGWRSPEYQEHLLQEAVAKYGSQAEAARWVATPNTSAHVSGDAVDIGPTGAAAWLSAHGAAYGLCQIYANEPWHFELRPDAAASGCPALYADPTHDPRMQQ
jgi:zinc D-Ala-D-Ala carboxypeptidase